MTLKRTVPLLAGSNAFGGNCFAVSPAGQHIAAPSASSGGGSGY